MNKPLQALTLIAAFGISGTANAALISRQQGMRFLGGTVAATGLLFFCLALPAHAASTWAQVGFSNPNYNLGTNGTNTATESYTSAIGSTARVTADATAGTIRGFAYAAPTDEAFSFGTVTDSFTLNGPAPGTVVSLTAYFTLDGILSGGATAPYASQDDAYVYTQFSSSFSTGGDVFSLWAQPWGSCYSTGCPSFYIPVHRVGSITLNITEGNPFDLSYGLHTIGTYGGTSDFGSTAAISFNLPAGTSITSDGGYTQAAVPVPAAAWLFGSGLLGLIGVARRKARGMTD